ncbi:related to RGP1 Reduced growth phenotype protein [Cephalotrichum gorgonifer]|uniref:Related to RGP1 Reduced growth phenotype protein n=1 Tax=Cephalotrichum gorgonifer TaxID=2041049 RepID=A0AAE8SW64_9PEZI|nr:related to RGP1 Reduced growth phenotype protein [Cephalotrichum gorgonifer]
MARDTAGSSDVRVFVKWHEQTVFAGEEVKCTITFRNVASIPNILTPQHPGQRTPRQSPAGLGISTGGVRTTSKVPGGLHPPGTPRGQRSGLSSPRDGRAPPAGAAGYYGRRRGRGAMGGGIGTGLPSRNPTSPIFGANARYTQPSRASTVPNTPSILNPGKSPRRPAADIPEFSFPAAPASPQQEENSNGVETPMEEALSPHTMSMPEEPVELPVRPKNPPVPTIHEHQAPPTNRILAPASLGTGTPRSSGEFYSMSNNSSETLASEYVSQPAVPRTAARPTHLRLQSTSSLRHMKQPESLMMGYAQIQGSFTLDGSLVDLAPFEQVKKKAVVGGQGGGVIGVETGRRDSGLLGSFGWGSISSSLGDFLGGGELSSIRDMRGIANTRAIPLLSTPQSILFVDMQLAPGESRAFEYTFRLPRGLPPTHRGKAARITYSLVIGTQRAGGSREQKVRSVDIPFRVLGGVNSHGELLGHDLMQPYIILQDQARVKALSATATTNGTAEESRPAKAQPPGANGSTINDFLSYVDELLSRPRNSASGLLSPTAAPSSRRPSMVGEEAPSCAKEAIDMAILRSNVAPEGHGSPNRFEIARNGRRVAVVILTRPAYRLGESVTAVVDFAGAEVPCYAVHWALETGEKVDASLAVRSEASVARVTRRVVASGSEGAMYARRVVFGAAIPAGATPEFFTSGVGLEWKVRLEFVVPGGEEGGVDQARLRPGRRRDYDGDESEGDEAGAREERVHPLLEEESNDQKGGLVLVAAEGVVCESFEVSVPVRVYGAVGKGEGEVEEEGMAV